MPKRQTDGDTRNHKTPAEPDKLESARSQGQAQFDSIKNMVRTLQRIAHDTQKHGDRFREDGVSLEDAQRTIHEDALSVRVRSDWYTPGGLDADTSPAEYEILLCTGGPAVRIIGTLSQHGEPDTAHLEVQDWFTPWTEIRPLVDVDNYDSEPILLEYAQQFYFGDR